MPEADGRAQRAEVDDNVSVADRQPQNSPPGWWLPAAGVPVAVWAMVPRYMGPELNTTDRVEIADHVVPGMVVLGIAVASLVMMSRRRGQQRRAHALSLLVCGFVVVLAGLWITATHLPLVAQASRQEVTWGAAIFHTAPGVAVLVLGAAWVAAHWSAAGDAGGGAGEPAGGR